MSKRRGYHDASEAEIAEEAAEAVEAEAAVQAPIALPKYPAVVEELIAVLKQSGTGKAKLDKLQAMITEGSDSYCKDLSGFLARCHEPNIIPEGTKAKIDGFFEGKLPKVEERIIEPAEGLAANALIEAEARKPKGDDKKLDETTPPA